MPMLDHPGKTAILYVIDIGDGSDEFDAPDDNRMKGTRCIYASFACHGDVNIINVKWMHFIRGVPSLYSLTFRQRPKKNPSTEVFVVLQ